MGTITKNVRKFRNLGVKFWKNCIMESRYWPKLLKHGVFLTKFSKAG